MKDSEKIDFSPLDPSKDEQRWPQVVAETARLARARRRRTRSVTAQLVAWGRPALAVAAALSLIAWSSSWWLQGRRAEQARAVVRSEQAVQLREWALHDEVPPPEVVLQVLGGAHDDR